MSSKTPKTAEQFIDYRFNETNGKIADLGTKLDGIDNKLSNNFATKEYVNERIRETEDKVTFLYKAMWGAISLILAAVLVTVLYSIGLRIR